MDSRFPTYYLSDRRVLKATPAAFRQFVMGTAWSVSNMTDGHIPTEDLPLVPSASRDQASELVRLGLWKQQEDGYFITDFEKAQTSAAQLEAAMLNKRERDKNRKQRDRRHERGDHSLCTPDKCSDAVSTRGMSADSPQKFGGGGKAEAEEEDLSTPPISESVDLVTGEITSEGDISDATPPEAHVSDATSIESLDDPRVTAVWNDAQALLELRGSMSAEVAKRAGWRYRELTQPQVTAPEPEGDEYFQDMTRLLRERNAG